MLELTLVLQQHAQDTLGHLVVILHVALQRRVVSEHGLLARLQRLSALNLPLKTSDAAPGQLGPALRVLLAGLFLPSPVQLGFDSHRADHLVDREPTGVCCAAVEHLWVAAVRDEAMRSTGSNVAVVWIFLVDFDDDMTRLVGRLRREWRQCRRTVSRSTLRHSAHGVQH